MKKPFLSSLALQESKETPLERSWLFPVYHTCNNDFAHWYSSFEVLSQNTVTCTKLKQITEGMMRQASHEMLPWIGVLSSIKLPLGSEVVLVVHLVFHNMIFIYRAKQHTNAFQPLQSFMRFFSRNKTLAAYNVDACSNIFHH